jgi:hypothetical protein
MRFDFDVQSVTGVVDFVYVFDTDGCNVIEVVLEPKCSGSTLLPPRFKQGIGSFCVMFVKLNCVYIAVVKCKYVSPVTGMPLCGMGVEQLAGRALSKFFM